LYIDNADNIYTAYISNGNTETLVERFDNNDGEKVWSKKYYGANGETFGEPEVIRNADRLYVANTVFDLSGSRFIAYTLDLEGRQGWVFEDASNGNVRLTDLDVNSNDEVIITGAKQMNSTLFQISVIDL